MRAATRGLMMLFWIALSSCGRAPSDTATRAALGPGEVATVNGQPIPESIFRVHALNAMKKNADDLTEDERKSVLNDLVGVTLMADEAAQSGLLEERAVAAQLELARMQLAARAMATRFLEKNPPSETELKALYDQNLPRLSGQQFKARHILLESKEEADAVIQELNQGRDFVQLAQAHADGPTGPNGGDLGWFSRESIDPAVGEAVGAMKVGEHSNAPVKTQYGYHVLLLEDTRQQEPPSLDAVRNDLVAAVQREKLEQHLKEIINQAKIVEDVH